MRKVKGRGAVSESRPTLGRAAAIIADGVRRRPAPFVVAVLGAALYGAMTVSMAWVVGVVTDRHVLPAVDEGELTTGRVVGILGTVGAVVLAMTLGVIARRIAGAVTMYGVAADDRRRVTRQYLSLPLSWHHRHPSGQLLSNANADVEATWMLFMPLPMALGVVVMLVVGLVQMALVDPVMALIGGVLFPLLMAVNTVYQRRMSPRATRAQQLRAEVSEVAHESLDASLVVKALGAEGREAARFAVSADRLRDANIAVGRTRGAFDPVIDAIPQVGTLVVLAVGTMRVGLGAMAPAEVVQVAYLITLLAFPVRSIGWVLGEVPRTVVARDRVEAVLSAGGAMTYGTGRLPGSGPLTVELDDVGYRYEGGEPRDLVAPEGQSPPDVLAPSRPRALQQVRLTLQAGRTVALVGPTGSGKSTLVSLLARLVDPTTGSVRADGWDVRGLAPGEMSRAVALVPQQTFLFDDTVRGNVTLGADIDDEAVEQALRAARAWDFVAAMPRGLDTRVGERGTSLSGGQRQRVALARALVRRPRLLLLDDATSAVDPEVELAVLGELDHGRAGATVLLVAHRMSTIALADEVIHLDAGRVVDIGTHEELLARDPGYRHLVTAYARQAEERAARALGEWVR